MGPAHGSLPAPGDVIGGKYRIGRVLGEGGMGLVYEAEHLRLEQRMALKFLRPELCTDSEVLTRFEREARAATRLFKSDHVAKVVDVDSLPDGTPFMVMEYLDGIDLADELERRGRLPVREAVELVMQACEAMAEAHKQGVVHRDLKPANLFLTTGSGGRRVLKVLDFGISKITTGEADAHVTGLSTALGTALYMSPEQIRSSKDVDARTDIWALGVVLYELLTGRTPFEGESAVGVIAAITADPVPPVRTFRADLPEGLERVLSEALEKRRSNRTASAEDFSRAIAPFAKRQPGIDDEETSPAEPWRREDASGRQTALQGTDAGWSAPATRGARARRRIVMAVAGGVGLGLGGLAIFIALQRPSAPIGDAPALGADAPVAKDPTPTEAIEPQIAPGDPIVIEDPRTADAGSPASTKVSPPPSARSPAGSARPPPSGPPATASPKSPGPAPTSGSAAPPSKRPAFL